MDSSLNQSFEFKKRNITGILVNHTYIKTNGVGESYTCSIKTNNKVFVLDHINAIFQSAFGKQSQYTLIPITYYPMQSEFLTGRVYNNNGKQYILRGMSDNKNGIILHYIEDYNHT